MVEQTNARDKLPDLQEAADKDDVPIQGVDNLSLQRHVSRTQTLALALRQDTPVARFQNSVQASLRSVHDPSERRAVVLQSSVHWLRELLDEWTDLAGVSLQDSLPAQKANDGDQTERLPKPRERRAATPKASKPAPSNVSSPHKPELKSTGAELSSDGDPPSDDKSGGHETRDFDWLDSVFKGLPTTRIPESNESSVVKTYLPEHVPDTG